MGIPKVYALSVMLLLSAACCLAQSVEQAPGGDAQQTTTEAKDAVFAEEQLDQMLAPIALYPDPLLAQVLMATTYPGEVAEAVKWSKAHPDAKGDDAVKQVESQPWDPSVQALVAFPQVLATLGQDTVWVQRLGDAFLAQPDDVMNAVQRLRQQAQAAGNLQTNQYQNVTVQAAPAASPSTIIIQPADPQVVYVPSYNPTTAYGTWAYPASPPVYYPPPPAYYPGSALVAGLAFGTGVAVVASLWGDCDWHNNDIDIDVNRYNSINRNNRITNNTWQHNSLHRDGVPYRDQRSREQFGRQLNGASQRQAYRGDTAQRAQAREKARGAMDRHNIERPARNNGEARARAQAAAQHRQPAQHRELAQHRQPAQHRPASRPTRTHDNAFAGARSPSHMNAQLNRGRASQAHAQRPHAARAAGHPISRASSPPARHRGGRR